MLRFARNDDFRAVIARSAATKQSRAVLVYLLLLALPVMAAGVSWSRLAAPWPDPASFGDIPGIAVTWPSIDWGRFMAEIFARPNGS